MSALLRPMPRVDGDTIGRFATACLKQEIATYPKPGLVSPVDSGSHDDMDAAMMERSADALEPFFADLAEAGAAGAGMDRLRAIGVAAEAAMMFATGGVNTHRGAIFGMGLLCAAVGFREGYGLRGPLGAIVAQRWAERFYGDLSRCIAMAPPLRAGMASEAHELRRPRGFPRFTRALSRPSPKGVASRRTTRRRPVSMRS